MHKAIEEWVNQAPPWLSDAIRRITKGPLTPQDDDEIIQILRAEYGFPATIAAIPYRAAPTELSYKQIRIRKLYNLRDVNAIEAGQQVEFLTDGLTIIYGDNGSGKSGYSRVLKHACRGGDSTDPVLPNVFKPTNGHPRATFELCADDTIRPFTWPHPRNPDSRIPNVAVFDSQVASTILIGGRQVHFLPGGLNIFPEIADLFKRLKARLNEQISATQQTPAVLRLVPADTPAGLFLGTLTSNTDTSALNEWLEFGPEQAAALNNAARQLADITANGVPARLEALRAQTQRISQLQAGMSATLTKLSDESIQSIGKLRAELAQVEKAITQAANQSFDEYLPGTGSESWRQLFHAAERFALTYAIPAPGSSHVTHCPLCQQTLDVEALDRFNKFRQFIQQDLAMQQAALRQQLTSRLAAIPAPPALPDATTLRADLGTLCEALTETHQSLFLRWTALQNGQSLPGLPTDITPRLANHCKQLDSHIADLAAKNVPGCLEALSRQVKDLEAWRLLASHAQDLRAHHEALIIRDRLNKCAAALSTNSITSASKSLTACILTQPLTETFASEVRALSGGRIAVNLRPKGQRGHVLHDVRLTGASAPATSAAQVLSEGEQKITALGGFFAELQVGGMSCAVFDDPVTSLDHRYQERIAARLAELALKRQVIVFTHDVFFLNLLIEECDRFKVEHAIKYVSRFDTRVGIIGRDEDIPGNKVKVAQRLERIRKQVAQLKDIADIDQAMTRRALACDLRAAWERTVEEVLFGNAVIRYRRAIQTQHLNEIQILPEDADRVNQAMTILSRYAHDAPAVSQSSPPTYAELNTWIDDLENFVPCVKNRRKNAGLREKKAGA